MMADYKREIEVAVAAVREASRLTRNVQRNLPPDALEKRDRSPVTVADFGSQALICRTIREAFPDDTIVAEEGSEDLKKEVNQTIAQHVLEQVRILRSDAEMDRVCEWIDEGTSRDTKGRFWTLDPVDGTKGFLRGDQYAISLALIEEGKVVAGVLATPNLGVFDTTLESEGALFAAQRGEGAWALPLEEGGEPLPISVRETPSLAEARTCESYESSHSDHDWSAGIVKRLGVATDPVRIDSQAKYAMVARGTADLYLRLPTDEDYEEKIWDHAAGAIVVREAGGTVTDVDGQELDFSRGWKLSANRGVIVTGGLDHVTVLEAVRHQEQGG